MALAALAPAGCRSRGDGSDKVATDTDTATNRAPSASVDIPVNFVELARRLDPSVVTIMTSADALGSGFVIDAQGFVVTNSHVVAGARQIVVKLSSGSERAARVVGRDEDIDVALLQIDAGGLTPAVLGDSDTLQVGEWVMIVGDPFGLEHTVTAGIVSAVGRTTREVPVGKRSLYTSFIQTDASINPGNSGGPMVDTAGRVVGMATAVDERGGGIGFAVPINMVRELLPALAQGGRPVRSWLGVFLNPVTDELAQSVGLPAARGAFISGIVDGSPAARAGLRRGDVMLEFDGHPVDVRTLPWRAAVAGPGRTVAAKVWRGAGEATVQVRMERLPE